MASKTSALIVVLGIAFILVFNIFNYDSIEGYDAEAHYGYVDHFSRYLPRSINLPDEIHTREFFNPPFGYLVPSIGQVVCRNFTISNDYLNECRNFYGNFTQIFQAFLYLMTIFINLATLKKFYKSKSYLNIEYLLLISLLAVNYRTISMVRGEPYILFFLSLLIYKFYDFCKKDFVISNKDTIFFGVIIGLLALSRQWAFLLFPPFFILLFYKHGIQKKRYLIFLIKTFFIGFLTSSWFYFSLFFRYGSFTAFNKEPIAFSFMNQPVNFYIPNFNDLYLLFTNPIRPNFSNQFFTTLYADTWGDYWGYFVFTSSKLDIGRNQDSIGSYLANVNILNLPLTIFLIISVIFLKTNDKNNFFIKYSKFAISFSLIGYLWFLISYPELPTGDTNKASYIIQIFNLMIFLGSIFLYNLKDKNTTLYKSVIFYLIILFIHNFDSYLSHFPQSLKF